MTKNFKIIFCILGGLVLSISPIICSSFTIFAAQLRSGILFNIINFIGFGTHILSFISSIFTIIFSILLILNNININKK